MRKMKNTTGNKHNRLHGNQIHKLNMWVEQNKELVVNSILEHSAAKASEVLGFQITKFNISHARENCGIVGRRLGKKNSQKLSTAELATYVLELYQRIGELIPSRLSEFAKRQ